MTKHKTVKFDIPISSDDPVAVEVSDSVDADGDRLWRDLKSEEECEG